MTLCRQPNPPIHSRGELRLPPSSHPIKPIWIYRNQSKPIEQRQNHSRSKRQARKMKSFLVRNFFNKKHPQLWELWRAHRGTMPWQSVTDSQEKKHKLVVIGLYWCNSAVALSSRC